MRNSSHYSGAPRGASQLSKSTHPRKFGNNVTVHRPIVRQTDRRPSARQENQCLLSHLLTTLGAQEETDCTSMLWSIDSCQNKVSAKQYHLTVCGLRCRPSRSSTFLKLSADKLLVFKWSQAQVYFLKKYMKYVVFMSRLLLLRFWFQTNHARENSASYLKIEAGKTFLTQVTRSSRSTPSCYALIGQNVTSEFMRKIYAASWNLFTLTAEADRVLCQLVIFVTVYFQNEILLLSTVFCYSCG